MSSKKTAYTAKIKFTLKNNISIQRKVIMILLRLSIIPRKDIVTTEKPIIKRFIKFNIIKIAAIRPSS